jgi:cytochrome c peroxidase
VPLPTREPPTARQIALGRRLFYDRRLSHNGTLSCAMCHIPEQGFTSNELATAIGIEGRTVRRNAPTVLDSAYLERLFHDGRETSLEQQVWGPLLARNEMGNPSVGALLERIRALPDYRGRFEAAFPQRGLGMETLGRALASYERTLVTGGSAFDRWYYGGEDGALGAEARRGFELFRGKAGCASCHPIGADHALFTDHSFHNTGIGYRAAMARTPTRRTLQVAPGRTLEVDAALLAPLAGPAPADLGRYEVSLDPDDRWSYRTPSLRNVALTAPYMHDGSLSTLADVIDFYDRGGEPNPLLDPRLRPLGLSPEERRALEAFLGALTGGDVESLVADAFAAPVGDPGSARPQASPRSAERVQ